MDYGGGKQRLPILWPEVGIGTRPRFLDLDQEGVLLDVVVLRYGNEIPGPSDVATGCDQVPIGLERAPRCPLCPVPLTACVAQ